MQSFSKEVGIGSSLHCLLGRDCNRLNISVSDVCWKVLSDAGGGEGGKSSVVEGISGGESIVVLELSHRRERRRVVIFPEKKEQNDSAIGLDGREFGSGLEKFRWRS